MEIREVPVSVPVGDVDWARIKLFRQRFAELWDNFQDLKLGVMTGTFARESEGAYSGGFNLPNRHRLKGLYVDFRHFYLNDEPSNARGFSKYLATLTPDADYRQFMKAQRNKLRSEFIEQGWFMHKGQPFTTKQILDIWFNAEIFHNDPQKTATMLEWNETLATETGRSLLFMAVMDSTHVTRNINWSCAELTTSHLMLRMPKVPADGVVYTYDGIHGS